MYRIGQFSQIAKVTVKALRFYEAEGLIEPCRVDPSNGYRYYDSRQLPRIHKILALRQCGFSVPEIRQIISGRDLSRLFVRRRQELEESALEVSRQLSSISCYIEGLKEDTSMKYQIVVKDLPRVTVFSKRMVVKDYDSYFREIPRLGEEIAAANPGLRCKTDPAYAFIIYHDGEYRERDMDVEYCEAVVAAGVDTPTIRFKTVDAVPEAACVMHKGPYSELRAAYAAVFKWIDDNHCVPTAHPREYYIDGIWNAADSAEWLTEVQVPIARDTTRRKAGGRARKSRTSRGGHRA